MMDPEYELPQGSHTDRLVALLEAGAIPSTQVIDLVAKYEAPHQKRKANDQRANRGDRVLAHYVEVLLDNKGSGEMHTDAGDLIADLLHAVDRADEDSTAMLLDSANRRFYEELAEAEVK